MNKLYQLSFRSRIDFLFKSLLVVTAIFAGVSSKVKAQVSAYSFSQSAGAYSPVFGTVLGTATGNASATNLNSVIYPVTLPFGFNFNGSVYTAINVSTNGFITFGSLAPTATNVSPISGAILYDGAVSAWGRDLSTYFDVNSRTGSVVWETVGTAPNREVVIEWKNFRTNSATTVTSIYSFSFQIRLTETSNVVKVVYDSGSYLIGNTAVSATAQVGLRGGTNADFNNRLNDSSTEFFNSSAGTANNSSQAFNTANAIPGMPTSGLTYTWTPPICFAPISVSTSNPTVNSVDLSWGVSPSSPSGGYDIYYNTSNTPPTIATPPNIVGFQGTSTTLVGLPPLTTYYVWVRASCGAGNTSVWSSQIIRF